LVNDTAQEVTGDFSKLEGAELTEEIQLTQEPFWNTQISAKLEFHLFRVFI
jgi:hypothetical protein